MIWLHHHPWVIVPAAITVLALIVAGAALYFLGDLIRHRPPRLIYQQPKVDARKARGRHRGA